MSIPHTYGRCQLHDADATVNAIPIQLYFPYRNAKNSMCMQYFSADELTTVQSTLPIGPDQEYLSIVYL